MSKRLDPEAQALLDVIRAVGAPSLHTLPVEQARRQSSMALATRGQPLAIQQVQDLRVPSPNGALALRVYRPTAGVLPMALFVHGGGWTLNDLDTHDHLCRRIAGRSGWLVASLDYRRAPEHPHPAALHDARAAYEWLLANAATLQGDPARVALVGESSGATTVAGLALLLRDAGAPPPILQILAYPPVDYPGRWPSYEERGSGYILDRPLIHWFIDHNLPPGFDHADPYRDPYLFPLGAPDVAGVAPALVMTAEFDPLRDEGAAYVGRLAAAGVPVEHVHAEDQMHGFLMVDRAIARAGELIDWLADALAERGRAIPARGSAVL